MSSKYELSISTSYVPDWGIIEAVRELFQNALDNETVNPENKMGTFYDIASETLTISNKTSKLEPESLLLGSTTKADDDRTIGQHGEGYKIAFMVLLRLGKGVRVYNYGAKEIWDVKLVKSKRYNGQQIVTVIVNKEAVWKHKPSDDLIIEVTGITKDEYNDIVDKNLHLRTDTLTFTESCSYGRAIINESEKGNIYVNGLYVCTVDYITYGYDFNAANVKLDRDRKLLSSFDIKWNTATIWKYAVAASDDYMKYVIEMFNKNARDIEYLSNVSTVGNRVLNVIVDDFIKRNGDRAVPVTSNLEYETVEASGEGVPVIVSESQAKLLRMSARDEIINVDDIVTLAERFEDLLDRVCDRLTEEEIDEFEELIDLLL